MEDALNDASGIPARACRNTVDNPAENRGFQHQGRNDGVWDYLQSRGANTLALWRGFVLNKSLDRMVTDGR